MNSESYRLEIKVYDVCFHLIYLLGELQFWIQNVKIIYQSQYKSIIKQIYEYLNYLMMS